MKKIITITVFILISFNINAQIMFEIDNSALFRVDKNEYTQEKTYRYYYHNNMLLGYNFKDFYNITIGLKTISDVKYLNFNPYYTIENTFIINRLNISSALNIESQYAQNVNISYNISYRLNKKVDIYEYLIGFRIERIYSYSIYGITFKIKAINNK